MSTTSTGRNDGHLPDHLRRKYGGERRTDFDDLLDQALADKQVHTLDTMPGPDGAPVPITTMDEAKILKNRIYACKPARRTHSVVMSEPGLGIVQLGPDRWAFRFRVEPKDTGREIIAGKADRGEELAYNITESQRQRNRARGKYVCPGCGHRRAREPGTRCLDCADRQAASRRSELDNRKFGENPTDINNWIIDHGFYPDGSPPRPLTAREHADRAKARQLGAQAERREQQRQRELREAEEAQQQASSRGSQAILSWFK